MADSQGLVTTLTYYLKIFIDLTISLIVWKYTYAAYFRHSTNLKSIENMNVMSPVNCNLGDSALSLSPEVSHGPQVVQIL